MHILYIIYYSKPIFLHNLHRIALPLPYFTAQAAAKQHKLEAREIQVTPPPPAFPPTTKKSTPIKNSPP